MRSSSREGTEHQQSRSLSRLQSRALRWIDVGWLRVVAELEGANICGNRPAIFRLDSCSVGIHHAVAIGNNVIEMTDRGVAQTIDMERWRLRESSLYHHPVAATAAVVALRTNRFESFPPLIQKGRSQLQG